MTTPTPGSELAAEIEWVRSVCGERWGGRAIRGRPKLKDLSRARTAGATTPTGAATVRKAAATSTAARVAAAQHGAGRRSAMNDLEAFRQIAQAVVGNPFPPPPPETEVTDSTTPVDRLRAKITGRGTSS